MGKIALVTGGSGFLGQHVAADLSKHGWTVIGMDNRPLPDGMPRGFDAYYEITLPDPMLAAVVNRHRPELCIHCAGGASVEISIDNPRADFFAGPVVTFELLEALRQHAPRCRVVYPSSAAVYGNPEQLPVTESAAIAPISPYGFHKYQCEQLCVEYSRVYGLATASARIFSAYGAGLKKQVVWDMCNKARQRALTLRGTGSESRDFIHARDVASGLRIIGDRAPGQGEAYNLASGRETTIAELARVLLGAMASDCEVQFDGLSPQGVPRNWRASIERLQVLGFDPTISLSDGIREVAQWYRSECAT